MDIKQYAVAATGKLHLRDANDELMYADGDLNKPMCVNLYGPGSKQYARAQAAQSNRMIDKLRRKGKSNDTAESRAAESSQFLADCTESFENVEYEQLTGNALAIAVYSDISIGFIADQVAKYLSDWSNFPNSSIKS
jgi:hypothetical protein